MNKLFYTLVLLSLLVSCGSHEEPKDELGRYSYSENGILKDSKTGVFYYLDKANYYDSDYNEVIEVDMVNGKLTRRKLKRFIVK